MLVNQNWSVSNQRSRIKSGGRTAAIVARKVYEVAQLECFRVNFLTFWQNHDIIWRSTSFFGESQGSNKNCDASKTNRSITTHVITTYLRTATRTTLTESTRLQLFRHIWVWHHVTSFVLQLTNVRKRNSVKGANPAASISHTADHSPFISLGQDDFWSTVWYSTGTRAFPETSLSLWLN